MIYVVRIAFRNGFNRVEAYFHLSDARRLATRETRDWRGNMKDGASVVIYEVDPLSLTIKEVERR